MKILGFGARGQLLAVLVATFQCGAWPVAAEPDAPAAGPSEVQKPDALKPDVPKSDSFTVKDEAAKLEAATSAPAPAQTPAVQGEASKPEGSADAAKSEPAKDTALPEAAKDATPKAAEAPVPEAPAATASATTLASDPVIEAVRRKLSDKAVTGKLNDDDAAAVAAFYGSRPAPVWIKDGSFTSAAKSAIDELKKADDWGLEAKAFNVSDLASAPSTDAQGDAELKLTLAVLKYARFARGGRVEPLSLSNILDMKPPLKDPKTVLSEISVAAAPDAYLRGLHPKHPEFEKLRRALLKVRGHDEPEEKIDEALKIKLPETGSVKPGTEHADIALLRKRLKVEAPSGSNESLYDDKLQEAVKSFQEAHELKASGLLNEKTRKALNREGEPKKAADPKGRVDLILVNMERWRWLPEELGNFYVMNNIPEFTSRVMKGGAEALKQKIIVGQPTWPTPVLTASMEFVIFHPEWGVPDGIKVKELLPRLKRASADYGGGFFDQLFSGGSSGGARVLAAYKLNPTLNGRPVDANKIDWNRVDIKQFSFVQPAGGENPLGLVKFRFPNRHDVYMHDTPQKGLFAQSFRALSHGCMRLENPRRMAEVILGEDKGWSSDKVGGLMAGSGDIALTKPVPVYLTYFTARVNGDGKLEPYSDIYGHDSRLMQALEGHAVRYNPPDHSKEEFTTAGDPGDGSLTPTSGSPKKKKALVQVQTQARSKGGQTAGDILSNALNGLLAN